MLPISAKSHLVYRIFAMGGEELAVANFGYDDFHETEPLYTPRIQSEYTLHYVLHGRGRLFVGDCVYTVGENEYFFVAPGERFSYYPEEGDPWDYVWFGFSGRLAASYIAAMFGCARVKVSYDREHTLSILSALFRRVAEKGADGVDALAAFYSVVAAEKGTLLSHTGDEPSLADRAAETLKMNVSNPDFRISALAAMLHVSHPYLTRIFHRKYGVSLSRYLVGLRLSLAATLLQNSDISVSAVAAASGYTDDIHFAKSFRKLYGTSPRAYRRSMQSGQKNSRKS